MTTHLAAEVRASSRALIDRLRREPEPLHAVLDAARTPRIKALLARSDEPKTSLYDGFQGALLDDYAPHLVRFSPGSPLLTALVEEGWGQSYGVYLTSQRPLREVRRQLRRFLIVRDDDTGERLYFRFYDPRVLRGFLEGCSRRQAGRFFDGIGCYLAEGHDPRTLVRFTPCAQGVEAERIDVRA